jgi:O-antigen/teichoic acid export membrane protein
VGRAVETRVASEQPSRDRAIPAISIVVVSRGPSLALARLLRSLRRAERIEETELLLGLTGGDKDAAWRLVERLLPGVPVQVFAGIPRPPAAARNRVLSRAAAPLLVFLDDDIEVPSGFVVAALDVMDDESVAVAGGPNLTTPSGPRLEQLAGRVLASPVGTGPLRDRYRPGPPGEGTGRNLMLCNLVVRRSVAADPLFDGRLVSAEENELLARLGRGGARIEYRPELAVYHHRRDSLSSHLRQMVKYGYGRGQMLVRSFSPGQLFYTVPALILLALAAAALFEPIVAVAALSSYLAVVIPASALVGRAKGMPAALALFGSTHLGYTVGLIAGGVSELARALVERGGESRRSPTARDAAGTFAALALAVAAGSAAGIVVARMLGPEGRGLFELARSLALIVAIAAGMGVGRAAIFLRGRGMISQQGLFGSVVVTLASGSALGAGLAVVLLANDWHGLSSLEIALTAASLPLIAFYQQGHQALRGIGQEAWYRRTLAVCDAIFLALLSAAFVLGGTLSLVLGAWLTHWLLGAAAIAWVLARTCGSPHRPARTERRLVVFGASQAALMLLAFVHLRLDLLILRAFRDAAEVGHYSVAFGVTEPLSYGGLAIGLVLFPRTVVSSASDPAGGRERTEYAIRAAFVLALAGAVVLALAGPSLVQVVFGHAFEPATEPLRVLLPGAIGLAVLLVLQSDLVGRGRIWTVLSVTAFAVAANALLALVLVPRFGATGAALASSTTYLFAAATLFICFRRLAAGGRLAAPSTRFSEPTSAGGL